MMAPTSIVARRGGSAGVIAPPAAAVAVRAPVDDISVRGRPRRDFVGSLAHRQALLLLIQSLHRTHRRALAAVDAARRIHVPRLTAQRDSEIAGLAGHVD